MSQPLTQNQQAFLGRIFVAFNGDRLHELADVIREHDQQQWCEQAERNAKLFTEIEALSRLLCRLCALVGTDPKGIERLVWYKQDGWEHGGSAITWQERAEELATEVKALEGQLIRYQLAEALGEVKQHE